MLSDGCADGRGARVRTNSRGRGGDGRGDGGGSTRLARPSWASWCVVTMLSWGVQGTRWEQSRAARARWFARFEVARRPAR